MYCIIPTHTSDAYAHTGPVHIASPQIILVTMHLQQADIYMHFPAGLSYVCKTSLKLESQVKAWMASKCNVAPSWTVATIAII